MVGRWRNDFEESSDFHGLGVPGPREALRRRGRDLAVDHVIRPRVRHGSHRAVQRDVAVDDLGKYWARTKKSGRSKNKEYHPRGTHVDALRDGFFVLYRFVERCSAIPQFKLARSVVVSAEK